MRRFFRLAASAFTMLGALAIAAPAGPQSPQQRQKIAEANRKRAEVTSHITAKRFDAASKSLAALEEQINELKGGGLADEDAAIQNLTRFVENTRKTHASKLVEKTAAGMKTGVGPKPGDATKKAGGVSFVQDVAPILVRNCIRCHGATNPRSKFSQNSYAALMKGGERGDDVLPGKPDESLLILMLQGKEEPRMPPGNRNLRGELVDLIAKWVEEGAKFDGAPQFAATASLNDIVPSAEEALRESLAAMSDSELTELHRTRAKEQWKVANPTRQLALAETDHFIVCGSVGDQTVNEAGEWCEAALRELNRIFGRSPRDVIWRGKLTVHIFGDRYQYGEHAQMIEQRQLQPEMCGHYNDLIETQYIAVPAPASNTSESLKGMVCEQMTAGYLATLGTVPQWFRIGFSRYVGAKLDAKCDAYREYRSQVKDWFTEGGPRDVMPVINGTASWSEVCNVSYGVVDFLASAPQGEKRLATMAASLAKKPDTDAALKSTFNLDGKSLTAGLGTHAQRKYATFRKR